MKGKEYWKRLDRLRNLFRKKILKTIKGNMKMNWKGKWINDYKRENEI